MPDDQAPTIIQAALAQSLHGAFADGVRFAAETLRRIFPMTPGPTPTAKLDAAIANLLASADVVNRQLTKDGYGALIDQAMAETLAAVRNAPRA